VNNWNALLSRRVGEWQQILREVLAGPIRFSAQGKAYRLRERHPAALVAGLIDRP